jgi:hypothetical protein
MKNIHWKKRVDLENITLNIISYNDLIQAKKASSRSRDNADADELEKSHSSGSEI